MEPAGTRVDERAGVGATEELSLRVSTGVLTKTTFRHPETGESMLVLERKGVVEFSPNGSKEKLEAQPLGGASRLNDPNALLKLTGRFNFDSTESAQESDFRVQIRPRDWPRVKEFCVHHFMNPGTNVVEADPTRELSEELSDALGIAVSNDSYAAVNLGVVLRGGAITDRAGVSGQQTVRAFNVYHVELTDPALIQAVLDNSSSVSDSSILESAREKAKANGKKGKASALTAIPLDAVVKAHSSTSAENRWSSIKIEGTTIADNVPAILCMELTDLNPLK